MICLDPYQPRFHILIIIPHSLPFPHTILITLEAEGMVNYVFFPSQLEEEVVVTILT
jgi:hypothetical protein